MGSVAARFSEELSSPIRSDSLTEVRLHSLAPVFAEIRTGPDGIANKLRPRTQRIVLEFPRYDSLGINDLTRQHALYEFRDQCIAQLPGTPNSLRSKETFNVSQGWYKLCNDDFATEAASDG